MCTRANRSRGFTITLNNYIDDEYKHIIQCAQLHTEKWIIGKEVGELGTPHLQGYIYFKQPQGFKKVLTLLNNSRIHLEAAKGNPQQNYDYCSKEGRFESKGFTIKEDMDYSTTVKSTFIGTFSKDMEGVKKEEYDDCHCTMSNVHKNGEYSFKMIHYCD